VSVFRNAGWFGIAGSQDYHTTPHCILVTWNCCFFVLSGTHITPNSLSFLCTLCLLQVFLCCWWKRSVIHVVWSEVDAPFPYLILGTWTMKVWTVCMTILNKKW
jgi:hypothetical protein